MRPPASRRNRWAGISLLLLILGPPDAPAFESNRRLKRSFDLFTVSIKPWFSQGVSSFRAAGPLTAGVPRNEIGLGETASFEGVDKFIPVLSAEVRPLRWLSFDLDYGNSSLSGGNYYDHVWLDAPRFRVTFPASGNVYINPDRQDLSVSAASIRSRTTLINADAYFRVLAAKILPDFEGTEILEFLDISLGYTLYDEKYKLANGQMLVPGADPTPTPPGGPFPGLDSTFELNWQAVKLGFREEVRWGESFFSMGRFAYAPSARYRGYGFYNLRTDLTSSSPQFVQKTEGTLIDWLFSVGYSPHKRLLAELGYQAYYFYAKRGDQETTLADGSITVQSLEKARAVRQGFYLNLSLKY